MPEPKISIIIPTYNSENHLENCLKSIADQEYRKKEVIVVDQESTDATQKIAKKYKAKLILTPKPQFYSPPSISRNIGAQKATGEILYHLDSDMILSKGLLNEIVYIFSKYKKVGALVVHEKDRPIGFWSRCKAFERRCYWGNDHIESARVVRTELFKKVKGYNQKISSGEDFDIHRRYKEIARIAFCKIPVEHNIGELRFTKLLSKKFNYGKTADQYFSESNSSGTALLKEELLSYIKHWRNFIIEPLVGLGSVFLKGCEVIAGVCGIIVSHFTINGSRK